MDDIDRLQEFEDSKVAKRIAAISKLVAERVVDPYCEDCGDEIPQDRREKMPSATRCVFCQGRHERDSRLRR